MRTLIAISVIYSLCPAAHALEAKIELSKSRPEHPTASKTLLYLRQNNGAIDCSTEGVPDHQIQVSGLAGLKAPFKPEHISKSCEQTVTWTTGRNASKMCYAPGKNKIVDSILRWCFNI